MLTQKRLKELLHYNPETGIFTWLMKPSPQANRISADNIAGHINVEGYFVIGIDGKVYKAHRLAWFYMAGVWPNQIDHINGIRNDNRWCNLRLVKKSQNALNRGENKNNTSGIKGVSWYKKYEKWVAQIGKNKKRINLGYFDTKEEAHAAYCEAAIKYFGEFMRIM
jgi:HNH endonuclease/AP2 domain